MMIELMNLPQEEWSRNKRREFIVAGSAWARFEKIKKWLDKNPCLCTFWKGEPW